MLDIKFIRENPDAVKENMKKKFQHERVHEVDDLLSADKEYRDYLHVSEKLRARRNSLTAEINTKRKAGESFDDLLAEAKQIPLQLKENEEKQNECKARVDDLIMRIPNMIHESVPVGKNDSENVERERLGEPQEFSFPVRSHADLIEERSLADFETSAKTSGKGFYYLKGDLALLNMALINYARDLMVAEGYEYTEPPLMIRKEVLEGVYSHAEIEAMSYKIEGEDLYLIATSEHPLIGMFIGKTLRKEDLPIKITGFSACFRKEIGSHGIDEKGLYRTHQFNKQEMIVICEPEDSYKYYDEMLSLSKKVFTQLDLPIRELECCSGDLGDLKAKSADLEAWSPRKKDYFEITSCTNMEEAQARRLRIQVTDGKEKYFAHTLNNTVIATSRAMVAILENNQQEDGSILVPKALVPYMNGKTVIGK